MIYRGFCKSPLPESISNFIDLTSEFERMNLPYGAFVFCGGDEAVYSKITSELVLRTILKVNSENIQKPNFTLKNSSLEEFKRFYKKILQYSHGALTAFKRLINQKMTKKDLVLYLENFYEYLYVKEPTKEVINDVLNCQENFSEYISKLISWIIKDRKLIEKLANTFSNIKNRARMHFSTSLLLGFTDGKKLHFITSGCGFVGFFKLTTNRTHRIIDFLYNNHNPYLHYQLSTNVRLPDLTFRSYEPTWPTIIIFGTEQTYLNQSTFNFRLENYLRNYYEYLIERKYILNWQCDLITNTDLELICKEYYKFLRVKTKTPIDAAIGFVVIDPSKSILPGIPYERKVDEIELFKRIYAD
ncbi:MAG: hypothetical protein K9W42_10710 [Candidatus Heimdallarchaeota archaeon]|nr:hypothetical protein [Candidatus Heimdallarchaeota archaeon]